MSTPKYFQLNDRTADIYWAGSLLPEIVMILLTQSTAVLCKYLKDKQKLQFLTVGCRLTHVVLYNACNSVHVINYYNGRNIDICAEPFHCYNSANVTGDTKQ